MLNPYGRLLLGRGYCRPLAEAARGGVPLCGVSSGCWWLFRWRWSVGAGANPCLVRSLQVGWARRGLGGRLARSRPSVRLSWWAGRPPPIPVSFLVCAGRPLAAGPRRLAGPYRGSSGPPCSRSWSGAHSLPASSTDEDLGILVIPISPAASRCTGEGRPVGDRSGVHVRARPQPHSARPLRLSAAVAGCRG